MIPMLRVFSRAKLRGMRWAGVLVAGFGGG